MEYPIEFLDAVLPSQGTRIFSFIMPGPEGARPVWQIDQLQGEDPAEVARSIDWALARRADAYVAIAGYGNKTRTIQKGKNAGQTKTSRAADNALWHRSLRIDIDCGLSKDYATQRDGAQALQAFIAATGMPAPLIVDSGYGIHCYWLFNADLDLVHWLDLSRQLHAAMTQHGLRTDPTATQDAARILRLPGSINFKHGAQRSVTQRSKGIAVDPDVYSQLLSGFASAGSPAIAGSRPVNMGRVASPLSANIHPPYSMKGVMLGCPGMRATYVTQGRDDSEPLWHAKLTLINAADDSAKIKGRLAKRISEKHPDYSDAALIDKVQQVHAQDYEPPTCETMARLGMPECATCPFRYTLKAPNVHGRYQPRVLDKQAAVPLVAPRAQLPTPTMALQQPTAPATQVGCFMVTPGVSTIGVVDGSLTKKLAIHNGLPCTVKQESPAVPGGPMPPPLLIPIGGYRIIDAERLLDVAAKGSLVAITFDRNSDGLVRLEFNQNSLTDGRLFQSSLSAAGMHYASRSAKELQDVFMPEFLAQIQRIRQASLIASRGGWTPNFDRFVLGTSIYSAASVESVRPSKSQGELEAYHTHGDELLWRTAYERVLSGGHDRAALLAIGLAAPLMAFSGVDGVLLNAYSPQSGVGKSTLCDAILSVWGAPDTLRKDFRDTAAATFHLAAISGNLPMVIDEFTNVDGKDLSNYIYTITQGRERHRLTSDAQLRDNSNRWCLPAIATSNTSVHSKLQNYRADAVAEAARVFEMRLYPLAIQPSEMGAAKAVIGHLKDNYGFLGPQLIKMFMAKGEAHWRKVMADKIAWWDEHMADDTSDRFRTVVAALIDVGAEIGASFGFAFDHAAIVEQVRRHWKAQIAEFEMGRTHPDDFVTNYITDRINGFAVFAGESGTNLVGAVHGDYVGELRGVTVNNKMDIRSVLIPLDQLKQYVVARNGDFKAVLEALQSSEAAGGKVRRIGRMTMLAGTPRSFRTKGLEFDSSVLGHAVLKVVAPDPSTTLNAGTP